MEAVVNGVKLGYEVLGSAGLPLVLIHGFGLDRSIWRNMLFEYMPDQLAILPDVRGHGESEAPTGPYTMRKLADDLAGLLDVLQIEKAIVCGHSMGGYISLGFADQYPQRLAGFGLITSRADADSDAQRESRYALIDRIRQNGSIELVNSLAPRLSKDTSIIKDATIPIMNTSPFGLIGAAQAMAERPDRTSLLPKIAVPALIVAGEEDQIIDLAEARSMAAAFPKGKFLAIPEAGHMPMWENPSAMAIELHNLVKVASQ